MYPRDRDLVFCHPGTANPLETLQHRMGHADSKTTQVYAHYQPSEGEADTVDRAVA